MKAEDIIAASDCKTGNTNNCSSGSVSDCKQDIQFAGKKTSCNYRIQNSCANCSYVVHACSFCKKHVLTINRDRGICDDFFSIEDAKKQLKEEKRKERMANSGIQIIRI